MFLKKLVLKNFKCLSDFEISFETEKSSNRKWTLILGENGTGKSNLLKAIALVTCGSNALGEILGNADSWITLQQPSCSITAWLTTKKGEEREISLNLKRGDTLSNLIANNLEDLHLIDEAIENAERNYFVVAYGASRRLSREQPFGFEQMLSSGGRSEHIRNLFDGGAALNPLTSWVLNLDYRAGESGIAVIKEALNGFLPGITFHAIDKSKKQVIFKTNDGLVPLEQLSDGYQNMAAWIGDLLYRITEAFKDRKNPLNARGLLLIDEIDLHLHPKWQRNLYDFISNKLPNFQVIATTHSPLTAQQAGEGELYALKRNAEQVVELIPFIGSPKTLLVNQLLMSPMFGLTTDESKEVEVTKGQYASLKAKGSNLTAPEKKQLTKVKQKLGRELPQRNSQLVSDPEMELLQRIEQSLTAQKA